MIALLIRLVLTGAVLFGVVFGVSKALKTWKLKNRGAIRGIQKELQALREGRVQGLYDEAEYEQLTKQIHARCEEAGIEVPYAD